MVSHKETLLSVNNLSVTLGKNRAHVVKGISFSVERGQTVALVGNSGSGKSVTAHAILGLLPKNAEPRLTGKILYEGLDLVLSSDKTMRAIRGQSIAMVFQEALAALNPTMTIGKQILEAFSDPKKEGKQKVIELLEYVGISSPLSRYHQYPHELSGGMRQRVVIAIALAASPTLLIADETTTALDVTIEAQILDLLRRIQQERKMAVLFITHDLSIVAGFCDTVYVMNEGCIVDDGDVDTIYYHSRNPYTLSLLKSARMFRENNEF